MDQIFVEFLLLDEAAIMGIAFLLIVIGGIVGAFFFEVRIAFRRIPYLWFLAGANLALMIFQLGWALVPSAATAGLLSVLIIGVLSSFLVFGAAVYYGSAARSIDINGSTENAWLGFVPFANLWLISKRGSSSVNSDLQQRSGFARFIADPLLVIGALVVFALSQVLGKVLEETPAYQMSDSAALTALVAKAQTLEESFVAEAAASARELPIRVDEITVFRAIEANGNTLRMTFDVEQDIAGFNSGFKQLLAEEQCAPEMFAHEIGRGGRIVLVYRGPNGRLIEEFEITQADCP